MKSLDESIIQSQTLMVLANLVGISAELGRRKCYGQVPQELQI